MRLWKTVKALESRVRIEGELTVMGVSNVKWNISELLQLWSNREWNKSLTCPHIFHVIMKGIMLLKFVLKILWKL